MSPAPEAVAISKKAFHRRHSAPLIEVGESHPMDIHKELERLENSEGVSRWKSAFKRLPSTLPSNWPDLSDLGFGLSYCWVG